MVDRETVGHWHTRRLQHYSDVVRLRGEIWISWYHPKGSDRWIAQACNCTCRRLVLVHCVGTEMATYCFIALKFLFRTKPISGTS